MSDSLDGLNPVALDLFRHAEAYRLAAEALEYAGLDSAVMASPISNLYFHAIELYLKSFLSIHGHPPEDLEGKFRQDFRRVRKRAQKLGLKFAGRDKTTIEYFVSTPLSVRLRYSTTPYYSIPTPEDLNCLCYSLRDQILG